MIFNFNYREPGSDWALERAKHNVLQNYLVVGVTEQLGDFIAVMEATVPRLFRGAVTLFNEGMDQFILGFA